MKLAGHERLRRLSPFCHAVSLPEPSPRKATLPTSEPQLVAPCPDSLTNCACDLTAVTKASTHEEQGAAADWPGRKALLVVLFGCGSLALLVKPDKALSTSGKALMISSGRGTSVQLQKAAFCSLCLAASLAKCEHCCSAAVVHSVCCMPLGSWDLGSEAWHQMLLITLSDPKAKERLHT